MPEFGPHCSLAPRFCWAQVLLATPCLASPHPTPWELHGVHPPLSLHRHPSPAQHRGQRERGFLPITLFIGHTHPHRHTQPDSRQEEEGPLVTSRSSAKKNAGRRRVSKDTLGW